MTETDTALPKEKRTSLELYLTAREAFEKWKADSDNVVILDVRTTEEYLFVGHVAPAWNIPVALQTYEWDLAKRQFPMKPNPDFITQVTRVASPSQTILAMCRSGGRSALAVNQLAKAGFRNVYNIIDGMEGDLVEDPSSAFFGQRQKNGWKTSGAPWTYEVTPDRMVLPRCR